MCSVFRYFETLFVSSRATVVVEEACQDCVNYHGGQHDGGQDPVLWMKNTFTLPCFASIPHICHFFYTGRIFENQILHPKKRLKAPKTLKMSLKKSNICIFSLNLEKFTPDRKFLHRHRLWCLWQIWGMVCVAENAESALFTLSCLSQALQV